MTSTRGPSLGGNVVGSVVTVGDNNTIKARLHIELANLPTRPEPPLDIRSEFAAMRGLLENLPTAEPNKLRRALDDAQEEVTKAEPDKSEVGDALKRALKFAGGAEAVGEAAVKLAPVIQHIAAWLGIGWAALLG